MVDGCIDILSLIVYTLGYVVLLSYINRTLSMLSDVKQDLFSATMFSAALISSLGTSTLQYIGKYGYYDIFTLLA